MKGLVRCAILRVPFLDPMTAMLDQSDALSGSEVSEWGDPLRNPDDYVALRNYAAYDNLSPQVLDNTDILITAGLQDVRVPIWHSLKYAARLRSLVTPEAQSRLLLKVYPSKGHFTDHEDSRLEESSLEIAFILSRMGPTKE